MRLFEKTLKFSFHDSSKVLSMKRKNHFQFQGKLHRNPQIFRQKASTSFRKDTSVTKEHSVIIYKMMMHRGDGNWCSAMILLEDDFWVTVSSNNVGSSQSIF